MLNAGPDRDCRCREFAGVARGAMDMTVNYQEQAAFSKLSVSSRRYNTARTCIPVEISLCSRNQGTLVEMPMHPAQH
jgi:hypothetical protein